MIEYRITFRRFKRRCDLKLDSLAPCKDIFCGHLKYKYNSIKCTEKNCPVLK